MRIWIAIAVALIVAVPAGAQTQARALAQAMQAVRSDDWEAAERLARQDGQVALDVIAWHRLRAGEGSFAEVADFIARNPDWPGLPWLRKRSEDEIIKASHAKVRAFFDKHAPQTPEGVLSYARALEHFGEATRARDVVVAAFRTMKMNAEEQANFLTPYGKILAPHVRERMENALWEGWTEDAERLLPLVSDDVKALARARIALRKRQQGVNALIDKVPAALQDDPGMAYERFLWRVKNRQDNALDMILERSESAAKLGRPDLWAQRRHDLAHGQMIRGNHSRAYQIASRHFIQPGDDYSDYAELEWLSGYIALRFLKKPELALAHFDRFTQVVFTPISLGRSGYWRGRALEELGRADEARAAYAAGAKHQTSFYGLLAAERAGLPADPALAGKETFPSWKSASWTKSSVHKAAVLLMASGEVSLAERFWTHLSETQDREALGQMGAMAVDIGSPHVAVMLGKRMAQLGETLPGPYYALHPMMKDRHPVPVELVLSIARRESEFDPRVVSGAGARGLMQVMPGTAKLVAKRLGIEYSANKLLSDPAYNARLGAEYLAMMADEFDGNIVMIAAGYNAGPKRPERWMAEMGDPRKGGMDVIDWIEHIPFDETRNYVMRVSESLPVYRARLGKPALPVPFSKELAGATVKRLR